MKNKTIECGDWHLGWGYGGNDKIGKLTVDHKGIFIWKGYSQGRHGGKWNYGAEVIFTLDDNDKVEVITSNGSYPVNSELIRGAKELTSLNKLGIITQTKLF